MRLDLYKSGDVINILDKVELLDSNMSESAGSYIDLESGKSGMGFIMIGDDQEHALFTFKSTGEISLIVNSDNVSSTSVNGRLVIRDNGSNVRIVNELGSTLIAGIAILYNV